MARDFKKFIQVWHDACADLTLLSQSSREDRGLAQIAKDPNHRDGGRHSGRTMTINSRCEPPLPPQGRREGGFSLARSWIPESNTLVTWNESAYE